MDHPELSPRQMLFAICKQCSARWDRKVSPDEIDLRIDMSAKYPRFIAQVGPFEGDPGGTPTQAIDNLLNVMESNQ